MNGLEKDDEIAQGIYTAEYWEYDARIGRRWNTDPVVYPFESPYATFHNNPIYWSDPTGADGEGPNGECPGDANVCEDGSSEVYGKNGVTGEYGWHEYSNGADVNGNSNPIPSDFLSSSSSQNYLKNNGLDASKVSIQFKAWENMPSKKADDFQTKIFGSTYNIFYDGQNIGSFQYTDGPVWMRNINTDISAKIPGAQFSSLDELMSGWPGGGGIDLAKVAAEDMINDKGGDAPVKFSVLNKASNVKFATVNLNVKGNPYNAFLNQTGLISNSSTSKLYQQYKATGILIYQNNRPVLKVTTKFEAFEAVKAGLEPAMGKGYDNLQNSAQDQYNKNTN